MEDMVIDHLKQSYNGKKVFLTGHTGFKGAWLLSILNILGADVKGYALMPANERSLFDQIAANELCESVIADIRDKEKLKKELLDYQPDFIIHMAAQPLVRKSYEIPVETFEVNAIGTANLLDSARYLDKPCTIIIVTTDKVYDNKEWLYPYRETDSLGGYDPYSASKACAELIISSYKQSFFNNQDAAKIKGIASVRAGNVIGGGDWSIDRIIPDIVGAIEKNTNVVLRNPDAIRPWQHVLEPLTGYLLLGAKLTTNPTYYSGAYNFGPYSSDALKVRDLTKIIFDVWGKGKFEIAENSDHLHEAHILKLDNTKAVEWLGWKPVFSSHNAVSYTIEWYKNYSIQSVKQCTFDQINSYFNLLG